MTILIDFETAFEQMGAATSLIERPRLQHIWRSCVAVRDLPGEAAELGVYKGGSAKIIAMGLPDKAIHLFEVFTGLPAEMGTDADIHSMGDFATDEQIVRAALADCPNVEFHVGLFPGTTDGLEDKQFSLVHLDADLYRSTQEGLSWFWPRLVPGGIVVLDDYERPSCPGCTAAIDEFVAESGVVIERTRDHQILITKGDE